MRSDPVGRRGASADPGDRAVLHWAERNRLRYYEIDEPSLPGRCLKVHLGHVTVCFHDGKLVRLWVHAEGTCLDAAFYELTRVFEFCARIGACVEQHKVDLPAAAACRA